MMQGKANPPADQISQEWLRRREIRAESFLHAIPDLMFLMRGDGIFLDYQPAKDIQPYVRPAEFLGRFVQDVLPAKVSVPCQHAIRQALATGEMQRMEYELEMKGVPCRYEARIVPSGADEVLVVVRDTSKLDYSALAARQAEADFRRLFEDCADPVALVDGNAVVFANSAMADLFGYESAVALRNLSILDLVAPAGRRDIKRLLHGPPFRQGTGVQGIRGATTFALQVNASEYQQNGRIYTLLRFCILSSTSPLAICLPHRALEAGCGLAGLSAGTASAASISAQTPLSESVAGTILTKRETEVLILIAAGQSTKQIASTLGIAYKTADAHRTHVMTKLGVHETASIVRYAIRNGLVDA